MQIANPQKNSVYGVNKANPLKQVNKAHKELVSKHAEEFCELLISKVSSKIILI